MSSRSWTALIAITALAAILRFYKLDVLPPGLFGDEALVTLHGRTATATGIYPIYFAQWDGGFHPAVVYLTLLVRWLTHNHPYSVRFGVAAAGVFSVPILFFCLREIFRLSHDLTQSILAALLGALVLAVTFPYVLINRLGFEVSLPASFGALVFGWLAAGERTGQYRYYVLSGAALGSSLYTYYSARLLPVAVTVVVVWLILVGGRKVWKTYFIRLTIIAAVSAIVFMPLGWYFLQNPQIFLVRATVTGGETLGQGLAGLAPQLLNSTARTVLSLSVDGFGDFIPRHNISRQAVYDPFLSILFWIGVVIAIRRWSQASSALLLTWAATLLLPVVLTMNLNSPHFTRMSAAMPALAGLAGLGALTLLQTIGAYSRTWSWGILCTGLILSTVVTSYNYFVRWANEPALFDAFQVGGWRAASLALERSRSGIVLLTPDVMDDPADAAFNLLLRDTPARAFPGPDCLGYYDRPSRPLTYVISTLHDSHTFDRVHTLFPTGQEGATIYHEPEPWPLYQVFEVPAGAVALPPTHVRMADFGGQINLVGYDIDATDVHPGDTVNITLYWQARTNPTGDFNVFVHLYLPGDESADRPPVAQTDSAPCAGRYVTSRWAQGEIVVDQHTLTVPPDFSADSGPLAVGLYGWPSLERLPVSGTVGILSGNRLQLTALAITR